jgi:hypothetical protein
MSFTQSRKALRKDAKKNLAPFASYFVPLRETFFSFLAAQGIENCGPLRGF